MGIGVKKYNEYFDKVVKVLNSCKTPDQLESALTMVERMIDYYPSLENDKLLKTLYKTFDRLRLERIGIVNEE